MLRSMFSAVSGLRSHQTMMDVTGNNIANVNTTGYKGSRTTFQETLTQLQRGGAAAIEDGEVGGPAGGRNPMQLGLGSQVAATDMVFTQGASQATGRETDLAIQGDGFFMVETGDGRGFMRSGAFTFDNEGHLVGPGGELVLGANDDTLGGDTLEDMDPIQVDLEEYTDVTIGGDGMIVGRDGDGEAQELARIGMARFANTEGLERVGNGMFQASGASGEPIIDTPGEDGLGTLQAGTLEMSNVDLAQEFTNLILSQRGFQANSRTITTSDELLQELVNMKR